MTYTRMDWMPKALSPNARVHWAAKAKAAKSYRYDCFILATQQKLSVDWEGPISVSITFHPPDNRRRDLDNLIAACKSLLDGLADAMGVNDSRFRLTAWIGEPVAGGEVRVKVEQV